MCVEPHRIEWAQQKNRSPRKWLCTNIRWNVWQMQEKISNRNEMFCKQLANYGWTNSIGIAHWVNFCVSVGHSGCSTSAINSSENESSILYAMKSSVQNRWKKSHISYASRWEMMAIINLQRKNGFWHTSTCHQHSSFFPSNDSSNMQHTVWVRKYSSPAPIIHTIQYEKSHHWAAYLHRVDPAISRSSSHRRI